MSGQHQDYRIGKGDKVVNDIEDGQVILPTTGRVLRGGSFVYLASDMRSALRNMNVPTIRHTAYGFRVARTLPLDGSTGPAK